MVRVLLGRKGNVHQKNPWPLQTLPKASKALVSEQLKTFETQEVLSVLQVMSLKWFTLPELDFVNANKTCYAQTFRPINYTGITELDKDEQLSSEQQCEHISHTIKFK